jgi:hypothetical protein
MRTDTGARGIKKHVGSKAEKWKTRRKQNVVAIVWLTTTKIKHIYPLMLIPRYNSFWTISNLLFLLSYSFMKNILSMSFFTTPGKQPPRTVVTETWHLILLTS